ncbi:ThuA domain-containing protein [Flavobacterium rhizosphaerae]|uniref:ThuA domain-containing protein n=1 Tax=Flavobacterium rhizosphaerae TaxID=3163298 RepID=A0ABW8YVS3_9FLAO
MAFRYLKIVLLLLFPIMALGQRKTDVAPKFKAIAFFTAKNDQAHISYVHEANNWFLKEAKENLFVYDTTSNWDNMNLPFLKKYDVVLFLDTRPEKPAQREAFQKYMENGGAWMGFHFAAFALNGSQVPQNWDWYHNTFLGSGEYVSNTWRPTSAVLKIENRNPVTQNLPDKFTTAPNEWYRWSNDLTKNKDITILLSIDPSSFPLGTGPKKHEIWHEGYYPVVWTNNNYKMLYINMGHNDIDYEGGTNKTLSYTFKNEVQASLIRDGLFWLAGIKNSR